ncbi:MAG: PhoPQ-activated pathogenicity-related family protein [Sedimentisphaerales bacterium]|nr:PhoPQ-activated pathogenicity-related family protein [Sedimentisphaerales bacterium]
MRKRHILAISAVMLATVWAGATPLDDYIANPDPSYTYRVVRTIDAPRGEVCVIDMTSQTWRSQHEVSRTVWQHWLTIIVPDNVAFDTALLWINGGRNGGAAPTGPDEMLTDIAFQSRSVVADLQMVPNQPLVFADDPGRQRYEDAIIACTFDKFLKIEDPNWPLLLPMVKSAVRAMDTIQNHLVETSQGRLKIERFVVCGASKRGWTTWLTAAVDPRVRAIAPVVIDVLNMGPQMRHHFAAYGFYSQAIGDYEQMKVLDRLDERGGAEIRNFVDPYAYRERYTLPKFLINSTGDQFFLPDAARFYFDDLLDEKHLLYCANTDHSLDGSEADKALTAWYVAILTGRDLPQFRWETPEAGRTVVASQTTPQQVTLWTATNPTARDFRLETIGKAWRSAPLEPDGAGGYVANVAVPDKGWTAYFVELQFDLGPPLPCRFSTPVCIIPDTLPFAGR